MNRNFFSKALAGTGAALSFWPATGAAAMVTYEFTATIATVSGTPFGYTTEQARTQPVTESFSYDTNTPDVNLGDTARGWYPHSAGGGFLATFLGTVITGSATPYVRIENLSFDTFRFFDGTSSSPAGGLMSVNGSPNSTVQVGMAFTSSNAFTSDALPVNLAFANPPLANPVSFSHTFSIVDSGGTLLLNMSTLNVVPEPSTAALAAVRMAVAFARRRRG